MRGMKWGTASTWQGHSAWRGTGLLSRLFLVLHLVCLFSLLGSSVLLAQVDTDSDGMQDDYEVFFLLNPSNAADAALNYDTDSLTNVQESLLWTDPWLSDTDLDGWSDGVDSNALSRAVFYWGDPDLTEGDDYYYTGPAWWTAAYQSGGLWQSNPPAWHVAALESNDVGYLHIDLDRTVLTTNLVMLLEFTDHSGSSLHVDLMDSNGVVVVSDLLGNLVGGTDAHVLERYSLPLADSAYITAIQLRRGAGEISVFSTVLYVDADMDGFDMDQELQVGTSDQDLDSDSDGLSDELELLYGQDPNTANSYSGLPFIETFETNTVLWGELHGQNGWSAQPLGTAHVKSNEVYEGEQSLHVSDPAGIMDVSHILLSSEPVVWVDYYQKVAFGDLFTGSASGPAVFYFNENGHLVIYDGLQSAGSEWVTLTNSPPIQEGAWVRLTCKLDYPSQQYLLLINGVEGVATAGFAVPRSGFTAFRIMGGQDAFDQIQVTTTQPAGLSLDGDRLSDDWENAHFGNLDQTDAGDPDGDGLNNLGESIAGSHPLLADSDGDGMGDGPEVQQAFDPLLSNSFVRIDAGGGSNTWEAGFEVSEGYVTGALHAQQGWVASTAVDVTATTAYEGGQSVWVETRTGEVNSAKTYIGAVGEPVVWMGLYATMVQGAEPILSESPSAAVYYISTNGLRAYHGTLQDWVESTATFSPDSNGWVRLDARLDFSQQSYSLWVNGLQAMEDLPFKDPVTSLSFFEVELGEEGLVERTSSVDKVYVSTQEPAEDLDNDGDGLSNADETLLGTDPNQRDSDGDFLSDAEEVSIGSDPLDRDSDNDSMNDGVEVLNGLHPLQSQSHSALPWNEDFETNTVVLGELNTQNAWVASPSGMALVVSNQVYQGQQALSLQVSAPLAPAQQFFTAPQTDVVWVDLHQYVIQGTAPTGDVHGVLGYYISTNGQVVVFTDPQTHHPLTNHRPVPASQWARFTARLDYNAQHYDLYLDGTPLLDGESFLEARDRLNVLSLLGGASAVDGIHISTNRPANLSQDEDSLPDDWELIHWVDLTALPTGDADADGLDNLGEYLAYSDPTDSDSDGDGLSDGWEKTYGFDPLTDDSAGDLDGDGLSNLAEQTNGTDPTTSDSDGDGLSDSWEVTHGFDPLDPADAQADPDADGLTNLEEHLAGSDPNLSDTDGDGLNDGDEIRIYYTNPVDADTDGDGLPDGWEITHHTDAHWNTSTEDPDLDQLDNLSEYLAGTDPNTADTDGDGEMDGFEVLQAGSDPLAVDFDGTRVLLEALHGTDTTSRTGEWADYGNSLYSVGWGGSLDYVLTAPTAGQYAVEIEVTQFDPDASLSEFELSLYADEIHLGKQTARAEFSENTTITWVLPYLPAGSVDLQVGWHYQVGNGSMRILEVRLVSLGGSDVDLNGQIDWVDHRETQMVDIQAPPVTSYISPICYEGNSLLAAVLTVTNSYVPPEGASPILVQQGVQDAWYANVSLSPTNTTLIQTIGEEGAVVHSNSVDWSVWNLLQASTNTLTLRKDDALLLNAFPALATNGTVDLEIVGVTNYTTSIDTAVPHIFDAAGSYTVNATWTGASVLTTPVDGRSHQCPICR